MILHGGQLGTGLIKWRGLFKQTEDEGAARSAFNESDFNLDYREVVPPLRSIFRVLTGRYRALLALTHQCRP